MLSTSLQFVFVRSKGMTPTPAETGASDNNFGSRPQPNQGQQAVDFY
jgi:hypothetical protein